MSSPNTPYTRMRKPRAAAGSRSTWTPCWPHNDTAMRFVLQKPEEGNRGFLIWMDDELEALIDWEDEVVTHGLGCRIKYARLVQRRASSPRAEGRIHTGFAT